MRLFLSVSCRLGVVLPFFFSCGSLTALVIVLKPVSVVLVRHARCRCRAGGPFDVCTISTISEIGVGTDITLLRSQNLMSCAVSFVISAIGRRD